MRIVATICLLAGVVIAFAVPALAKHRYHRHYNHHHHYRIHSDKLVAVADANGNVVSHKTGARARVAAAYAARFQAYINDIEATGAQVKFMGGIRSGHCSAGHQHPCGKALDVCQLRRGVVDASCHLPNRVVLSALALKNGLFEGALWCNNDYGHAQVDVSSPACRHNLLAAVKRVKEALVAWTDKTVDPEAKAYFVTDTRVPGETNIAARTVVRHTRYASRRHVRTAHRHRVRYVYAAQPTYQYAGYNY